MNDGEFGRLPPENPPLPPEHADPSPETRRAVEFNDRPDEYAGPAGEEERRGGVGNGPRRQQGRQRKTKENQRTGRGAMQLAALTLSAVTIVTAASALSGGRFLPELGETAIVWVEKLNAPPGGEPAGHGPG